MQGSSGVQHQGHSAAAATALMINGCVAELQLTTRRPMQRRYQRPAVGSKSQRQYAAGRVTRQTEAHSKGQRLADDWS